MALRYCFEQSYVTRTLAKSKPHDLAVVDTEGHEKAVRAAVSTYAEHGAILFSSQCNPIKNGCYIHMPDPTT